MERTQEAKDRATPIFLYVCCFLSGTAALCYEITWAKILSHTFGGTLGATAAVVAGFMGGMGIGAWAYARVRDRVGHPLLVYAVLELAIAATAIAATQLFDILPNLFATTAFAIPPGPGLTLTRFAMTFVILLLPAALMGATFPALCTVLIDNRARVDRHLGALYGVNTVGGAIGALVAGMILIEWIGLRGTALVGAAANAAIGLAALGWRRRATGEGRVDEVIRSDEPAVTTDLSRVWIGAVLLLSGFATLCYEILWFRSLQHLFGNSTYALTIMLVIFLLGLGLGAQLLGPVSRRKVASSDSTGNSTGNSTRDLALVQLGIGLFAIVAIGLQSWIVNDRSFESLAAKVSIYGSFRSAPWLVRLAIAGVSALAMMLPATLLMGLSFPMASRLFLSDVRHLGERVGGAVLLSNLGSIFGSILAALWILPALGVVRGTHAVALINFALGAALLFQLNASVSKRLMLFFAPAAAALALVAVLPSVSSPWFIQQGAAMRVVFLEEGHLSTVSVLTKVGQPDRRAIALDGMYVGVTRDVFFPVYQKQLELAHLPMSLDNRIRNALSIGLGSGATHASLLGYPQLESVTCIEINEGVLHGASFFEYANAQSDPRSEIVVDDALHYLRTHPRRYDLVISDGKQASDFSGNAKLLALEFYELVLSRLEPNGLFAQWIPISMNPMVLQTLLRTAATAFPELEIFYDLPGSLILVGSNEPLAGRPRMSDADIAGRNTETELNHIFIPSLDALRARWVSSKSQLRDVLGDGPLSTWDHSPIEFEAYKHGLDSYYASSAIANLRLLIEANQLSSPEIKRELTPPGGQNTRVMSALRNYRMLSLQSRPAIAVKQAAVLKKEYPDDPMLRHWIGETGK